MQQTSSSVELTVWARSFPFNTVAATAMSIVLEGVERRLPGSPVQTVSRAVLLNSPRLSTPGKVLTRPLHNPTCFSGTRPGSGCPAGPGDRLPGGPTPPPAELCQRGELPVLVRRQDELALRPPTPAALLLPHYEPGPLRLQAQSDERELDMAPVSQVERPTRVNGCYTAKVGKNFLSTYSKWHVVVALVVNLEIGIQNLDTGEL